MKKGQWSSTKAMGNYLHGDDEGKRKAQLKRIAKRGTSDLTLVEVERGLDGAKRCEQTENFVGSEFSPVCRNEESSRRLSR